MAFTRLAVLAGALALASADVYDATWSTRVFTAFDSNADNSVSFREFASSIFSFGRLSSAAVASSPSLRGTEPDDPCAAVCHDGCHQCAAFCDAETAALPGSFLCQECVESSGCRACAECHGAPDCGALPDMCSAAYESTQTQHEGDGGCCGCRDGGACPDRCHSAPECAAFLQCERICPQAAVVPKPCAAVDCPSGSTLVGADARGCGGTCVPEPENTRVYEGFCVDPNGRDVNHGIHKHDDRDLPDTACVAWCLEQPGATGCERVVNQGNKGCYYFNTPDIHRGNGVRNHVCWIFAERRGNEERPDGRGNEERPDASRAPGTVANKDGTACGRYATGNTQHYDDPPGFIPLGAGKAVSFSVKASNDAHVGFFSDKKSTGEVYEIVISGWGNTRSVIRQCNQCTNQVELGTGGILDGDAMTDFWADAVGGLVRLGKGRVVGDGVLLSWQDPDPHVAAYVGLMTGWGATGAWLLCADPDVDAGSHAGDAAYKVADGRGNEERPDGPEQTQCQTWFDGCNTCHRVAAGTDPWKWACTKMACAAYVESKCLDEPCAAIDCPPGHILVDTDDDGCGGTCVRDPKPCAAVDCPPGHILIDTDDDGCGGTCVLEPGTTTTTAPTTDGTTTTTAPTTDGTTTTTAPTTDVTTTTTAPTTVPLAPAAPEVVASTRFVCTDEFNFIGGVEYRQRSLTDGCDADSVCDANPIYGAVTSIADAVAWCTRNCETDDSCTGFFFQKHTNGHEICGFYATDMHAAGVVWQKHGHADGSQICEAPEPVPRPTPCTTANSPCLAPDMTRGICEPTALAGGYTALVCAGRPSIPAECNTAGSPCLLATGKPGFCGPAPTDGTAFHCQPH